MGKPVYILHPLAAALLSSVSTAWGQEALEVSVNRNPVRVGEQVQLTFTLKNVSRRIDGLQIEGLKLLYGPSTSNSTSISTAPAPVKLGTLTPTRSFQRRTCKYPPRSPRVEGNAQEQTVCPPCRRPRRQASGPNAGNLGNVACVIETSKRNVHIGEPIVVSFKIFNRANNLDVRKFNIPETLDFGKKKWTSPNPDGNRKSFPVSATT